MKRAKSLWSLINPRLLRAWRLIKYRLLRAGRRINDLSQGLLRVAEAGMVPLAIGLLIAVIVISVLYWDSADEIRNVGLIVAAIVALPIAIWRSRIAEREVWDGQYQKGAELLGHPILVVRLAGLHTLRRLVEEHPEEHYIQIMRLCAAFLRNPPPDEYLDQHPPPRLRDDVQQAMQLIGQCRRFDIEEAEKARTGLTFVPALFNAQLDRGHFRDADWTNARLVGASLRGAKLNGINLTDAHFDDADLSGADFTGGSNRKLTPGDEAFAVSGLTQKQLDLACADPDCPPLLNGLVDAKTAKRLVWRGKARNRPQ